MELQIVKGLCRDTATDYKLQGEATRGWLLTFNRLQEALINVLMEFYNGKNNYLVMDVFFYSRY